MPHTHPNKADRGGEDALFTSDEINALGVSDGVGSWYSRGVDPGIYARELMRLTEVAIQAGKLDPVQALRIQEKGESFERDIPIDEIGSIFRGKTKSTKEYVWGGIKLGGLVSLGIGGSITVIFLIASGLDLEALPSVFLFGGLWTVVSGIYTVPGGALLGFIRAKAAEGKAVEYVIGDGQWVIVN